MKSDAEFLTVRLLTKYRSGAISRTELLEWVKQHTKVKATVQGPYIRCGSIECRRSKW
jgi:hypothetical protein